MGEAHPEVNTKEMYEDPTTNFEFENVHPESLDEKMPETFAWFIYSGINFVTAYGWFILLFSFLVYYIWNLLRPKYERWQEDAEHHKNPDKFTAREFAISEARKRLQEKYDAEAKTIAAKYKEDEEKRQNDSRQPDVRQPESSSRPGAANKQTKSDKSSKPRLRPAYNPMMGDTSSCGWSRPSGRRSGGG